MLNGCILIEKKNHRRFYIIKKMRENFDGKLVKR